MSRNSGNFVLVGILTIIIILMAIDIFSDHDAELIRKPTVVDRTLTALERDILDLGQDYREFGRADDLQEYNRLVEIYNTNMLNYYNAHGEYPAGTMQWYYDRIIENEVCP